MFSPPIFWNKGDGTDRLTFDYETYWWNVSEDEIIGEYSAGVTEMCTKCWYKNPKKKDHLENLGIDGG
jgi:hypothetical protein